MAGLAIPFDVDPVDLERAVVFLVGEVFEKLRLSPYLCSAGKPTIGYGSTRYANGMAVSLRDPPITREQAKALFLITYRRDYLPAVAEALAGVPMGTPGVLLACISFAYNCGVGALRGSTMLRRLRAGDWNGAANECRKWNKSGGRVTRGLVKRREIEARLILGLDVREQIKNF